jgi:Arc/MetJ-type ribon-helix-helix transcriptional regulator
MGEAGLLPVLTRELGMMYHPTMPKTKVAVTIEAGLLDEVDELVLQHRFANRSQAIEAAVSEQLVQMRRTRLAEACALLDPAEERALAEEALAADLDTWPEY